MIRRGSLAELRRLDARYVQLAILGGYAVGARELFHYERDHLSTLATLAVAVGLDLLIGRLKYGKTRFPLIALIVGLGASIQVDARGMLPFLVIAALATLSKAFVTYQGRHIFNPTNLGVVALFLLFPGLSTGFGSLFSGFAVPTAVFFALGTFTVILARTALVSFGWLAGFALLALFRSGWLGLPVGLTLGTIANPMMLLFTFHMISDPATTPATARLKLLFGASVALVDTVLRMHEVPYGHFYALFAVSCFTPWIRDYESRMVATPAL